MSSRGAFGSYDSGEGYGSYQSSAPAVLSGGGGGANEFTRLSQSVSNNIQKITQNVAQLQKLVNQIGTQQDNADLRDRLHQVQHYTNQLAKDTKNYLTELSHLPNPINQSDQKQRRIQKDRLMNDFTTSLNNFQAVQRKTAEKERESLARARAHSGSNYDPFSDDRKSDEQLVSFDNFESLGRNDPPQSQSAQQSLQMEEDVDLELMRERDQSVRKLESDIMDVNQIFKDLGMLVHEQGEVIDSIEANVESASVHVEDGTEQLRQARDYQSKARRKKCILLLILLIILIIIAVIIAVTVPKN
ncbi:hypothetical protein CAPTEDRAFT_229079 [Capitella teleta]|uniref:Syntaxin-7 n=1 Tax=Capitella teleta TaxID=283909 RepID=X2B1C3_CAPTE|nr:hypothetical protein CAPTEDRAFT_229079 [Capitella teleta]|eukprot:ELU00324.1 hypothetical protein CAPTEDRAFT_229079 [Capitella teleta]